jgi:tetratricopeptide (TPR) repeat protein
MARAAVKAKQQAKAQAQATKSRGRRRRGHSGGGNPNQDLFFVKMRRHQKWLYGLLAVVFAIGFVGVGVGSGNGAGLDQIYSGIFGGGGGDSVSKAQDAIKKDPKDAKAYRDLATAYEQKGDNAGAANALNRYLALKKTDAATWGELGGLQLSQGNQFTTQYQNAQQAAQIADPSAPFLPGGVLGSAVGQNPAYQGASQTAASQTSLLYQKATSAFSKAVTAYQKASHYRPHNTAYPQLLATAAANAGNNAVAAQALRHYLKISPNVPNRAQIEKEIKALSQATPAVQSGG